MGWKEGGKALAKKEGILGGKGSLNNGREDKGNKIRLADGK